jgi:hypothetical protein
MLAAAGFAGFFCLGCLFLVLMLRGESNPLRSFLDGGLAAAWADASKTGAALGTKTTYKVGNPVAVGNWEYTATRVNRAKTLVWSNDGTKSDARGIFLSVYLTLKNIGSKNLALHTWDFELHDASGLKYDPHPQTSTLAQFKQLGVLGAPLAPEQVMNTVLVFDVDSEAKGPRLWVGPARTYIELAQ